MATWGDLERLTWDQLAEFTHDELERLTIEDIERYLADAWPVLTSLTLEERVELKSGMLGGAFPPPLFASADNEDLTKVQGAALKLWTDFQSRDSQSLASWLAVMLAALSLLHDLTDDKTPPPPPPPVVIIKEIPEPVRPLRPIVPPGGQELPSQMSGA